MAQCRSENMTVGPVTLAFPHLFQPQKPRDSNNEPKYNAVAILTRAQYDQLLPLMMFSASAFRNGESNRADFKWGMKPCSNEPERYPVAAQRGMYFMTVSCSQEFKPRVVDANRQDIIDPGVVRDGTQAYISVNFYDYNKAGNIGVAAGLGPVMIVGDGEVLNTGGGVSVDAAFAGVQVQQPMGPGGAPMQQPPMQQPQAPQPPAQQQPPMQQPQAPQQQPPGYPPGYVPPQQ